MSNSLLSLFLINRKDFFVEDYGDFEYAALGIDIRCVPMYGQIAAFYAIIRQLDTQDNALLRMYAEMCVGLISWDQYFHDVVQNLVLHFAWAPYGYGPIHDSVAQHNFPLVLRFERCFVERNPRYLSALQLRRNIPQGIFLYKMWRAKQGRARL